MHFDTLAPWLVQLILGDVDPFTYYDNEDPFRATLAMLRAKNVPVLLLWTGGQTGSPTLNAWQTTKSLIRRVYAAEVSGIKSVYGDVPEGFDGHEKTMLEYTLRDATGEDYVSSVRGEFSYNEVDNTWEMLAGIEVYFDVRLKSEYSDTFVDLVSGDFKYEINVESVGDVENLGIIERVLAWDYLGEEWVYVPTREGELSHGFNTPDGTSRRTFLLPYASSRRYAELAQEDDPDNPNQTRPVNRMKIRVVHKGPVAQGQYPGWHHSEFDLVQVIPIPVPSDSFEDEGDGLAAGDLNFDGIVGESDLDMFANAWLGEKPVADLNMDEAVDDFDLEAFIESYNHQP